MIVFILQCHLKEYHNTLVNKQYQMKSWLGDKDQKDN